MMCRQLKWGLSWQFISLSIEKNGDMLLNALSLFVLVQEIMKLSQYSWAVVVVGVGLVFAIAFGYRRRNDGELGYQSLVM